MRRLFALPPALTSVLPIILAVLITLTSASGTFAESLTVYAGRSRSLVDPIIRQFSRETGIDVEVRYGGTSQLALAIQEEGTQSPADVFFAQDAGALGALEQANLLAPLPKDVLKLVPEMFHSKAGAWIATTGRARVLAYSPERVKAEDLPSSVFDMTSDKWKGRVGWAPTNASFQSFVTAMRQMHGQEKTLAWLKAMKANGARAYSNNTSIIRGIADGEVDLGLPNHYYLLRFKTSDSKFPVEQTSFKPGDVGNLVNVAGVGVLKSSKQQTAAAKFVAFLLSDKAQQYFTSQVFEYPVTDGVIPHTLLLPQESLEANSPKLDLNTLDDLDGTLALLREAGVL